VQAEAATREPVSYLAIGPVFGTQTKDTGYDNVGLERVAAVARIAGAIPVVAIGGITLETAAAVIAAGASAVAVIGDLLVGGNPRARTEAYLRRLAHQPV
jgi:thiamine-phosphate pyrophosphorylase